MQRYVIVGAGAAGISAVLAIRSKDKRGETLMISDEKAGYYSRPGLAYLLTDEIPESSLFPFSKKELNRLQVKLIHDRVIKIDANAHLVELHDGRAIKYDRLLVAIGAQALRPSVPGNDLNGVVKLDKLTDARTMIKLSRKAKAAVVVGGGITALEIVEGLRARGVKVHYFLRQDRYWGRVLDEIESKIVENRLKDEGVNVHYHTEVGEILGKRGKVVGVVTKDGKQLKCGLVAFAVGIRPRLKLARASGLDVDRGILVNDYLETNLSDVYAAGDAAQVYDPITGRSVVDSLWEPARQQGYTAGLNMSGQKIVYKKSAPFNVTRLAGLTTTIIGAVGNSNEEELGDIVRGESETWQQIPDAIACQSNFEVNRLRVFVGDRTLTGAIVMGNQTLSEPLQRMVSEQVDISTIRDRLIKGDTPISEILIDFWTKWRQKYAA